MDTVSKETLSIHELAKLGQLELLQSIVSEDNISASLTDATGNTPLHTCSAHGHIHIVFFLCEVAQVSPSPCNSDGQTPLHLACEEGHLNVASYLTDARGCDPSAQDNEGKTPLHLAAANNRLSIVRYLVEEEKVDVNSKTTKTSNYILRDIMCRTRNMHINSPRGAGKTPLHYACLQGHAFVVEYFLMQRDCNVICLDENQMTPLFLASMNGHLHVVRMLVDDKGYDIYKRNIYGNIPLHTASLHGHLAVVRYFVCEKGIDPEIHGQLARTPLLFACWGGHQDVISFLHNEQGCDMVCDENNITPLYVASMNGHLQVVRMLVDEKGCDISSGSLPLFTASLNGHLAVVRYFVCEKGVRPASLGLRGRTFLQWASHSDVQQFLSFAEEMWTPLTPSMRILIVGDSTAGKSSLLKALTKESFPSKYFYVKGVEPFTAGIVPFDFTSKHYGQVTFYDFAGHREYYPSHTAVLDNDTPNGCGIFLLVINLAEEEYTKKLLYWLKYLESVSNRNFKVIVIGSHSDLLLSFQKNQCILNISELKSSFPRITGFVTLDCRNPASSGMSKLHALLESACNERERTPQNNLSRFLLGFLKLSYKSAFCSVSSVVDRIRENKQMSILLKSSSVEVICELLESLNSSGHILYIKNPVSLLDSWIVLDKAAVLSQVQTLKYKTTSNIGLVTYSQLKEAAKSKGLDEILITEYLLKMEYCFEVNDKNILFPMSHGKRGKLFFFPELVKITFPKDVWLQDNQKISHHFSWMLKCSSDKQFFTPRFTQVLLLHLASSTLPDVSHLRRHCSLWRNGICWADDGVECLVEASEDSSAVRLMMRVFDENFVRNFCLLRSSILQQILSTHQDYCSQVETTEFLLMPSAIQQYPPLWNKVPLFSMLTIADVVTMGRAYVPIHKYHEEGGPISASQERLLDILPFEPLVGLSSDTIKRMFESPKEQKIPDEFLLHLAKEVHKKSNACRTTCNLPLPPIVDEQVDSVETCFEHLKVWRSKCNGTFGSLIKETGSCSVFCGRNILDLSSTESFKKLLVDCEKEIHFVDGKGCQDHEDKPYQRDKFNVDHFTEQNVAFEQRNGDSEHSSPISQLQQTGSSLDTSQQKQVDESVLCESDLLAVLNDLGGEIVDWKMLGVQLGLFHHTLQKIDVECRGEVDSCVREMLVCWLKHQDGVREPSWFTLVEALRAPIVNMAATAKRIAETHPANN